MTRPTDISNHYPAQYRDQLVSAATNPAFDPVDRVAAINGIIDQMAEAGLCKPRNEPAAGGAQ